MILYRTNQTIIVEEDGKFYDCESQDWDGLINENLYPVLQNVIAKGNTVDFSLEDAIKPIVSQEVWACGVTYLKSKVGRQEESKDSGGADFYGKVYVAERPEVFFKATPSRVVGPGEKIRIRRDSTWDVPEPELTLCVNKNAQIVGYTIGNDMSSRSIEGENPLYLPQAKTYDRCAALGPGVLVLNEPISLETKISLEIVREGAVVFYGEVLLNQMKRSLTELVGFVCREASFPHGCFIMTGTGIVPTSDFTLEVDDKVKITIEGIGTLVNIVEKKPLD
ncbi:MAG: fumarylacetoacetate hydrolase family protein [Saprospiraceae bacterium]|nr:fumarylacetoacetate hydrolase family protein [Saprospiraceae bacterium]MBK8635942.1 fumarylacetoacetate hydrolase family protein [Saprospiraceae bacterium]